MIRPLLALLLLSAPAFAAPQHHELPRADGSVIHYTLDTPDGGAAAGLLLIAQGSGCMPGAATPSLHAIRTAFPNYAALIVEKIGITPDSPIIDGSTDCPVAFTQDYTLSQRVADYVSVVTHLGSDASLHPDRLILFGGSEGGLAVSRLLATLQPAAAILLSTGSHSTFGEMVRITVPPEGHPTIDAGFARARANPDSSELFAGSTYRFWADLLDYRAIDDLLATATPLLLIQGGHDTSAPLAEARATADAFAAAGRCNLTYWEFPAFEHSMRDPSAISHLNQVARLAAAWAADTPCQQPVFPLRSIGPMLGATLHKRASVPI